MDAKIYFSFPGFYTHHKLLCILIDLWMNNRELFNEDVILDSIYDGFPCLWNGGRYLCGAQDLCNVQQTLKPFENTVDLRLTFTNGLVTEQHFFDTYCNVILNELNQFNGSVGITISSNELKQYIESQFPDRFYFNWSATKCLEDIEEINHLSETNLVIPSYQYFNNKEEHLAQLLHPENIELIVDEGCNDDCPYRRTHYLSFNKAQLLQTNCVEQCAYHNDDFYYGRKTGRKHNISLQQIRDYYLPRGFNKFKITGREEIDSINLIESFVLYLIKPEYQNDIRNQLLHQCIA